MKDKLSRERQAAMFRLARILADWATKSVAAKPAQETPPLPSVTTQSYTLTSGASVSVRTYSYNGSESSSSTDANGNTETSYSYNADGRLRCITDHTGRTTYFDEFPGSSKGDKPPA